MSRASRLNYSREAALARLTVAENLMRARLDAGLKQIDVARGAGLTQSMICRHESGATTITVSDLAVWAKVCGCTVADLVEGL